MYSLWFLGSVLTMGYACTVMASIPYESVAYWYQYVAGYGAAGLFVAAIISCIVCVVTESRIYMP